MHLFRHQAQAKDPKKTRVAVIALCLALIAISLANPQPRGDEHHRSQSFSSICGRQLQRQGAAWAPRLEEKVETDIDRRSINVWSPAGDLRASAFGSIGCLPDLPNAADPGRSSPNWARHDLFVSASSLLEPNKPQSPSRRPVASR